MITEVIIICAVLWYLIGSVGSAILTYREFEELDGEDIVICFTIFGIGGAFTLLIIWIVSANDKVIFKKK